MTETIQWGANGARPLIATLLHATAAVLREASDLATRTAVRLSEARALPAGDVEFHAVHRDAGALEGAIYVNGELVGVIDGLRRL